MKHCRSEPIRQTMSFVLDRAGVGLRVTAVCVTVAVVLCVVTLLVLLEVLVDRLAELTELSKYLLEHCDRAQLGAHGGHGKRRREVGGGGENGE